MNPFIGQILLFGGNFAPRGWAFCDGQLLSIAQNTALFSILGTTYGGDGRTTFALPDMRGRFPMHAGTGPGLTTRKLGQRFGLETNTVTVNQLAFHHHLASIGNLTGTGAITGSVTMAVGTTSDNATGPSNDPNGRILTVATDSNGDDVQHIAPATATIDGSLGGVSIDSSNVGVNISNVAGPVTVTNTGNQQPLNNLMPCEVVNHIIAMQGTFPSRS